MVTLVFTSQSSLKKRKRGNNKRLEAARLTHEKEVNKLLGESPKRAGRERPNYTPNLEVKQPAKLAETSDRIPVPIEAGSGYSRDLFFRLYRQGSKESAETLLEVQRKARNVGPAYNKGGLVYQTRDPSEYRKVK